MLVFFIYKGKEMILTLYGCMFLQLYMLYVAYIYLRYDEEEEVYRSDSI